MDGRQRTSSMSGVSLVESPQLAAKFRLSGCALSFWASLSTSTIFFLGRLLYMVELNARTKRRDEDWAAFGDAVRVLADKAYPELAENARERLALNQFLEQIENSQVAFSVKQKRPRNVEEAAAAVIELESYLRSTGKPSRVNAVSSQEQEPETHHTVPAEPVSAVMHFARRARLVNSHHEITVRETAASGGAHRRKRAVRNTWGK